jgi:DNA-binding NarL/FixJ family response regulator
MERKVGALVACGMTNKEIATQLRKSEQTIKRHVASLMLKLNVFRRSQIAIIADREEWDKKAKLD